MTFICVESRQNRDKIVNLYALWCFEKRYLLHSSFYLVIKQFSQDDNVQTKRCNEKQLWTEIMMFVSVNVIAIKYLE